MPPPEDRPYVNAWLKRVGRQLRGSGRISQVALALSGLHGGSPEDWGRRLRDILHGRQLPTPGLITDIDRLLAAPVAADPDPSGSQARLF